MKTSTKKGPPQKQDKDDHKKDDDPKVVVLVSDKVFSWRQIFDANNKFNMRVVVSSFVGFSFDFRHNWAPLYDFAV